MYSCVRATGILKESDGAMRPLNLAQIPLNQLYANYLNVEVVVIETTTPAIEYLLDLDALPSGLRVIQLTLPEWLVINGNKILPTTPIAPEDVLNYARFSNLWQHEFQAELCHVGYHPDTVLSEEELRDIRVSRLGAEYDRMARNGLLTINGFLHRVDHNEHGLYALHGGVSRRHSGYPQLGYLDLSPVAAFETIPITPAMIYSRIENQPLNQGVYLNVGKSLIGKTAFLVVGGWLHALDDYYKVVGDTVIRFDFQNYPWFRRYMQTKDYLDLSSFGDIILPHGAYSRDALYSDAVIRKWFSLPQSFIILLDTPEVVVGHVSLEDPKLTGRYYTRIKPNLPLMVGDHRLTEYVARDELVGYVVNPAVYLEDQLVVEETTYLEHIGLAYRRRSDAPVRIASARWLRIGRVKESV